MHFDMQIADTKSIAPVPQSFFQALISQFLKFCTTGMVNKVFIFFLPNLKYMIFHRFTCITLFIWLIWQLKRLQHQADVIHNKISALKVNYMNNFGYVRIILV